MYNTNLFVLQELGMTCGAGFLIMINYILNQNIEGGATNIHSTQIVPSLTITLLPPI